ncbi:MAG TPA: CocE/NonD family hydrolase [Kutzneria sp.]|nr:CocE/NonD family hydrolase [Kutzneria sp.]
MRYLVDTDVPIVTRDGVALATNIWRPADERPAPVLLLRTPYGKDDIASYGGNRPNLFALLAAGYAVVIQCCRGTARSEGVHVPHETETADSADTVAWLREQPWCDGNIGGFGASYQGAVQWQSAELVQAIAPTFGTADFYLAPWYSPGGAMSLHTVLTWITANAAGEAMKAGAVQDLPEIMRQQFDTLPTRDHPVLARHFPWLDTVFAHPDHDGYWQRLAPTAKAPALSIGGWYDVFVNETVRTHNERLIIGPWTHLSPDYRSANLTDAHLRFFDQWLRGKPDDSAPVRIFVMGIDQWRDEPSWPLPDTRRMDYFLGEGTLSGQPLSSGSLTYRYDPLDPVPTIGGNTLAADAGPRDQRPVEARADVLCFTGPALADPLEVTGHVSLTLFVSSDAVDTDFMGKLVDVHPDGSAINLCEGMLRARYRNSLSAPELMTPGRVYELTLDLSVTSNVFLPGHRIRLEVASSNFPRYDRNPNTGGVVAAAGPKDVVVAENTVHFGPGRPSRLSLPVIPNAR